MRDANSNVQLEAISAASFLQSPDDAYCSIINAYMFLLRHDSYQLVRIVILDNIALNNTTFNFLKDELIHDTDPDIRRKVIKIMLKKISNKFIVAKLRRKLVETVINDDQTGLLKALATKWLTKSVKNSASAQDRLSVLQFLKDLSLPSVWFQNELTSSLTFKDQKLFKLMTAVFDQDQINDNIAEFNATSAGLLFESFGAAFHFKSLVIYCYENNLLARFNTQVVIQSNVFYSDVIDKLCFEEEISPSVDLHFYQLLEASYYLDMNNFEEKLVPFVMFMLSSTIKCHRPDLLIYQAVLSKLSNWKTRVDILKAVWNYYSLDRDDLEQLKKCLGIFSACMVQLTKLEYIQALRDRPASLKDDLAFDEVEEEEQTESLPKFLFKKLLLNSIQSQDPSVRALTIRIMGTLTLLDSSLIETSFPIFINVSSNVSQVLGLQDPCLTFSLSFRPWLMISHKLWSKLKSCSSTSLCATRARSLKRIKKSLKQLSRSSSCKWTAW